jgi:hypothetical protein
MLIPKFNLSFHTLLVLAGTTIWWPQIANSAEICGEPRQGQYAEERICATLALTPTGEAAASLNGVPAELPWLFPDSAAGSETALTLQIKAPGAPFATLQILNGWAPDESATAGGELFEAYGRAKLVLIETSDGRSIETMLSDSFELQFVKFDTEAEADWVKLTVKSIYPGKKSIAALRWVAVAWEDGL